MLHELYVAFINVFLCCVLSLCDRHLSQSRVRDDHRVLKGKPAAHLPHLLRHVSHHDRLLRFPDQVSQGCLSLCSQDAVLFGFAEPEQTGENNTLDTVTLYLRYTSLLRGHT